MNHLEWYRIFWHTAQEGNLTRAAEHLHMTQPSVSYSLKQLEKALAVKLYYRMPRGIQLTEEGKVLFTYVDQALSLLEAGERRMSAMKHLAAGQIRIGASDSLIKHLLLPHLNSYHQEHPEIRLRLSRGKTSEVLSKLHDGLIDCALVHMPVEDPLLRMQELAVLDNVFVVGEAYSELARSGKRMEATALAELPLLMLSPGSSTRVFVEEWFARQGVRAEAEMELGSVDLLAEFARLGYGAACIARSFVQQELGACSLFELPLQVPIEGQGIALATRIDLPLSLAAEQFVRRLLTAH